jgi:hypothetical protein
MKRICTKASAGPVLDYSPGAEYGKAPEALSGLQGPCSRSVRAKLFL